jgi:hypothetical protein
MGIENQEDDGLTAEERAALQEDETEEEAGNETEDPNAEEDGDADAGGDATDADADEQSSTDESGTDDAPTGEPGVQEAKGQPLLIAEAPAEAETKLAEIAQQKKDLRSKYDEGDLTFEEYEAQKEALDEQRLEIKLAVEKATLAADMEQQRQKNAWLATVNRFLGANPIYAQDKNPRLYRALDAEVRELASKPEAANWTGEQLLAEAHKNLSEAFGLNKPEPNEGAKPKGEKKPIPKPALPPTLAKVPAAEATDTSGGRFAALDRLLTTNPLAYEEALAKLSENERNEYLAA